MFKKRRWFQTLACHCSLPGLICSHRLQLAVLGRWRSGQDSTIVAALLHRNARTYFRGRLCWPRPSRRGTPGAAPDRQRPRDGRRRHPCLCQQTGPTRSYSASRTSGTARDVEDPRPPLDDSAELRFNRGRTLRGTYLAYDQLQIVIGHHSVHLLTTVFIFDIFYRCMELDLQRNHRN